MPFGSLWLPVLASAAAVWMASAIVWMALPHHKSDYWKLPSEEGVADTLRKLALKPGAYLLPHMRDAKNMKDPAVIKKYTDGPLAMITMKENGLPKMGASLVQYFIYCFLVSFTTAYVARHTMNVGASRMFVFQLTGTVAIMGYAYATIPESIWMWRPWRITVKNVIDAVAYGLITGAIFACLWPKK
jgi:hypothetical protein